ncbi:unnamed protein product [Caenorhabditis auriculariae]|uniref:Uncharacterized protein n=1 Tax=Caenorhabditis auriculariae TaxID=2777116 RepID=A0A8S1HMN5_9PELO|nr:unnamed protein product [Caenorhabditis auriculariae]
MYPSLFYFRKDLSEVIHRRDLKTIESMINKLSKEEIEEHINEPAYLDPILEACRTGFFDVVKLLLRLGADPCRYRPTYSGRKVTALQIAIEQIGSRDISKLFNRRTRDRFMVLQVLLNIGKVPLKMRLDSPCEPPLFTALKYSNFGLVKYLCERGASVQDRNKDDQTCFMVPEFFKSKRSVKIFEYLVAQGLSVNAVVTETGETALHFAVIDKNFLLVKLLISAGAILKDENVLNPILLSALEMDNSKVFGHLLEHVENRKLQKDAMLLRATTILLEPHSEESLKRLECLKTALEMTTDSDEEGEKDKNPDYDDLREATSFSEFEAAGNLWRFTIMQCFIIRERILGESHPEVRDALFRYARDFFLCNTKPSKNYDIVVYTVSLFHRYEWMSERSINAVAIICNGILMASMLWRLQKDETRYHDCFEVATVLLEEIYMYLNITRRKRFTSESYQAVGETALSLICVIGRLGAEDNEKQELLEVDLGPLVRMSRFYNISLFHSTTCLFVSSWVPTFVRAGANINAKDANGRTALQGIIQDFLRILRKKDGPVGYNKFPVVLDLVNHGSRLFLRDEEECLIFDSLQEAQRIPNFEDPIVLGKYITLKDICAEVVEEEYPVHFLREVLPLELLEYLSVRHIC